MKYRITSDHITDKYKCIYEKSYLFRGAKHVEIRGTIIPEREARAIIENEGLVEVKNTEDGIIWEMPDLPVKREWKMLNKKEPIPSPK